MGKQSLSRNSQQWTSCHTLTAIWARPSGRGAERAGRYDLDIQLSSRSSSCLQGQPPGPAHPAHLQGHRGASRPRFTASAFQLFLAIFFSFPFYRIALGSGGSLKEFCLSGPAQLLLTNPRNFFPLRKEANPRPTSCLILLRLLCKDN